MERFEVKRGLIKTINSEGGLKSLANKHFENVNDTEKDGFSASWGLMTQILGHYDDDGKLVVDVLQLKGTDLQNFLEKEGGREAAMESRKRWSANTRYGCPFHRFCIRKIYRALRKNYRR